MFENNKLATQNVDVAFQLRALGQQLELLSMTYKDLKYEMNSIKQQNSGADHRENNISDFEEYVDENIDMSEDYEFASVGQGIRSGPKRVKSNVNFHGMGIMKI